jgi:predicted outer membrane repeat protein
MNTKFSKTIISILVAALMALAVAFSSIQPARAATCIVTSAADSGDGSLRAMLADASCDTITFTGDTTIHLASQLVLAQDVTIDGGEHSVVISGDNAVQPFLVNAGVTAALQNLTLENGHTAGDGGAINNAGNLTVSGSTFSSNHAAHDGGAIYNTGSLIVTGSTFTGNSAQYGGGIINTGTLTVTNSTFSGNSAVYGGGGIYSNGGTVTLTNSTFSGNSANYGGGGVIYNWGGTLTVTNSTFSGNSAFIEGGAIDSLYGSSTVRNSLFVKGTTGVNCYGNVNGSNSLTDDPSCTKGFTQSSNLLLGSLGDYGGSTQTFPLLPGSSAIDAGGSAYCPAFDQRGVARPQLNGCDIGAYESRGFSIRESSGDQVTPAGTEFSTPFVVTVSAKASGEPVNGGLVTFTAPADGASATLTGSTATIANGQASMNATANDIVGDYEMDVSANGADGDYFYPLNCGANLTVTTDADSGEGSLRQAIAWACPGGNITFAGDTTIHLASQLVLSQDVTIDGGEHSVVISGDTNSDTNGDTGIFEIRGGTATLKNLVLEKGTGRQFPFPGHTEAEGGAVYVDYGAGLNLSDSTLLNNHANYGGAILNEGTLTVTGSTFSGNSAFNFGGAIKNLGTLIVTGSTFSGNSAVSGSGIENFHTLTVTNSTFSGNIGAAIENDGNLVVTSSTFSGNSSRNSDSGAFYQFKGSAQFTNNTFFGNTSTQSQYYGGGGAYNLNDGSLVMTNNLIARGSADNSCSISTDYNPGYNPTISGDNNLTDDPSCTTGFTQSSNLLLGSLDDYGGATQTIPLLPGSPAIDAGDTTACSSISTDQRGLPRLGACDIGAFESQGFSLAVSAGDNQQALSGAAFINPLEVTVSSASGEPVDGGLVTFSAPAYGASATITGSPATISGGKASVTAVANVTPGSYNVTASASGATSVNFALTNNGSTDATPPIITPTIAGTLGQNGWYVSNVTLSWSVVDEESNITSTTGCDPVSITSDQPETLYTCTATSTGGTSSASASIKRDATSPVVAVTGVTGGSTYILGAVPKAACSTTDATSDVATNATLNLTGGNTLGVGSFTATCSGAIDNAGNAANPVSVQYNVTFLFTGFSQPVDNPTVMNISKAGQIIPLKFRITDANGNPITNLTSVTVTAVSLSCSVGTSTDLIEEYATGSSGLQNLGDGYYQWNWKTPTSYANSCKTMKLDLGEGLFHTALFQFKK